MGSWREGAQRGGARAAHGAAPGAALVAHAGPGPELPAALAGQQLLGRGRWRRAQGAPRRALLLVLLLARQRVGGSSWRRRACCAAALRERPGCLRAALLHSRQSHTVGSGPAAHCWTALTRLALRQRPTSHSLQGSTPVKSSAAQPVRARRHLLGRPRLLRAPLAAGAAGLPLALLAAFAVQLLLALPAAAMHASWEPDPPSSARKGDVRWPLDDGGLFISTPQLIAFSRMALSSLSLHSLQCPASALALPAAAMHAHCDLHPLTTC